MLANNQASFRLRNVPQTGPQQTVLPPSEPVVQSRAVLEAIVNAYGLDRLPDGMTLSDVKGLLQVGGGTAEFIARQAGGNAAAPETPFTITWQIDRNPGTSGADQGAVTVDYGTTLRREWWWRIDHIHMYLSTFNAGTAINLGPSIQPAGNGWGLWRTNNGAAYVRNDYSGPLWVPPGQTFQVQVPSWNKALAGSWAIDVIGIQSPIGDPMSSAGAFDMRMNPI